jgi:putative transposase
MPRPPRADEAGGLYHALNLCNLRAEILHKDFNYYAFERIFHEGRQLHQVQLLDYQLMPNHYHLILRPLVDGEMSRLMGWESGTHTMRYHAHHHTSVPFRLLGTIHRVWVPTDQLKSSQCERQ